MRLIFTLFLAFWAGVLFGQVSTIDSLTIILKSSYSPEKKIEILIQISKVRNDLGEDSLALIEISKAEDLITSKTSVEMKADVYHRKGVVYRDLGLFVNAKKLFLRSLEISKMSIFADRYYIQEYSSILFIENNLGNVKFCDSIHNVIQNKMKTLDLDNSRNLEAISTWYNTYAIFLFGRNENDLSIAYFQKYLLYQHKIGDNQGILNAIQNLGFALDKSNRPTEALKLYFDGVEFCKENGLKQNNLNGKIGALLLVQTDYETSRRYSRLAIGKNLRINIEAYTNIGVSYLNEKKSDSAKYYISKSINLGKNLDSPAKKSLKYNNLGVVFFELENNIDSAIYYLNLSLENAEDSKLISRICGINYDLGRVCFQKGNFEESIKFLLKSFELANSIGMDDISSKSADFLCKSYESLDYFQEALHWTKISKKFEEEYQITRRYSEVEEFKIKYETEQKENEILRLSNENNIEKAKSANLRLSTYGITGVSLLVGLVVLFLWYRRKQKHSLAIERQKAKALEDSIDAVEAEKRRIGKELHDVVANDLIAFAHEIELSHPKIATKIRATYREVRNVSHKLDYHHPHKGLFIDYMTDLIVHTNQSFHLKVVPQSLELSEVIGGHVYRIIQELMVNTMKHSNSDETTITVNQNDNTLEILYHDTGGGTDSFVPGNGHKNIADRIKLLNGEIKIKTAKGNGFIVKIQILL